MSQSTLGADAKQLAGSSAIYAVGIVVNTVASLALISSAGIVGAGAATAVSYLATAILFIAWTLRLRRAPS